MIIFLVFLFLLFRCCLGFTSFEDGPSHPRVHLVFFDPSTRQPSNQRHVERCEHLRRKAMEYQGSTGILCDHTDPLAFSSEPYDPRTKKEKRLEKLRKKEEKEKKEKSKKEKKEKKEKNNKKKKGKRDFNSAPIIHSQQSFECLPLNNFCRTDNNKFLMKQETEIFPL